ncbi:MAG TPA: excalibur calcium-binding domain-containing protein [Lysobacter sp.]
MGKGIIAACVFAYASGAWAHGGGLNAEGCHHDRKNGGYHCHRAPARDLASTPAPRATSPYAQSLQRSRSTATVYRNCTHARAAGAAPVRRGDPGYGPHLDRDGDGVGCE